MSVNGRATTASSLWPRLTALVATWSTACSTVTRQDLAKRDDYLQSMALHAEGEHQDAIGMYPDKKGERGGFIATLERGWLGLIAGRPEPDSMIAVGKDLEDRKTMRVTSEAKSYFYKETESGYIPAEHEAVAFHLVNGLALAMAGRQAEATVEARRATLFLQNDFGTDPGFDDAALRLWLAALWAYCGDWESARVDFRVIAGMGPAYAWAKELAERKDPPAELSLVFVGPGPDLAWDPEASDVQAMTFVPGAAEPVGWTLDGMLLSRGAPTAAWYTRHRQRDFALREVLHKSRYYVEGTGAAAAGTATLAIGATTGAVIIVAGVALGLGIVYASFKALVAMGGKSDLAGYIVTGGVIAGTYVAYKGVEIGAGVFNKSSEFSAKMLDKGFNPIHDYRYVRFLPDHIFMVVHDAPREEGTAPSPLKTGEHGAWPPFARLVPPKGQTTVNLYYASPAGGGAALASAAQWTDHGHRLSWSMLALKATAKEARSGCAELPGAGWRLPTWQESLDARTNGLKDHRRNQMFGRRLSEEVTFWAGESTAGNLDLRSIGRLGDRSEGGTGDGSGSKSSCRVVDAKEFGESTVNDCATVKRHVLCVRPLPE